MSKLLSVNDWLSSFYSKDFYKNTFNVPVKKSLLHLLIIGILSGIICFYAIFNSSINKARLFGQVLSSNQPLDIDPNDEFIAVANMFKEQIPTLKIINKKLTSPNPEPVYIINTNIQKPIIIIDVDNKVKEFAEPSIVAMVKNDKILINSTNKKELQHMNQEYNLNDFLEKYDGETIDNVFLGHLLEEKSLEIQSKKGKLIILTIIIAITIIFSTVACISFSVGIFLNFLNKKNTYKNIFNIVSFAFTPAILYQMLLIAFPISSIANLGGMAFFAIFFIYIIFGLNSAYSKK